MSPPSAQEAANKLFTNSTILAPMVRASTTPLRTLAISYGASLVYTEELVDRSIMDTERVINEELGTIDYIKPLSSFPGKVQKRMLADSDNPDCAKGAILLRIDPTLERNKIIYQIGTGEAGLAIKAAERVVGDVSGIDVNMGCPKKFSVSGGMGSALLSDPKRACDIISTLSRNISKPVSAKIRLLHPTDPQPTLDFVRSLINAGANAITIHGRIVEDESQTDARWETLVEVVKSLKHSESVPIIINGDLYTHADIREMRKRSGCDGVMLARPALYNMSLFKEETTYDDTCQTTTEATTAEELPLSEFQTTNHHGHYGYNSPLLSPRTSIIQEYVSYCVRYRNHSKNAKYVVCEMLSARRAPLSRVPFLNMSLEGGQTVNEVCQCRSLSDLVKIWDVKNTLPLPSAQNNATEDVGGMGDLHNYSDDYFLKPDLFDKKAAAKDETGEEKKTDEETPGAKRQKI